MTQSSFSRKNDEPPFSYIGEEPFRMPYTRLTPQDDIRQFKKGGIVGSTGVALVHKGELVVPAHRVEAVKAAVKKAGLKPLNTKKQ